jgi:hypothetical protein
VVVLVHIGMTNISFKSWLSEHEELDEGWRDVINKWMLHRPLQALVGGLGNAGIQTAKAVGNIGLAAPYKLATGDLVGAAGKVARGLGQAAGVATGASPVARAAQVYLRGSDARKNALSVGGTGLRGFLGLADPSKPNTPVTSPVPAGGTEKGTAANPFDLDGDTPAPPQSQASPSSPPTYRKAEPVANTPSPVTPTSVSKPTPAGSPATPKPVGASVDLKGLPKPAKTGGDLPWEELVNDPDVDYRIHNHPLGLSKGHTHYNGSASGKNHLWDVLGRANINSGSDLKNAGADTTQDVVLDQDLLDKLARARGKRQGDPSLVGTTIRVGKYRDSVGRTNMISHVFPPGVRPKGVAPAATSTPTVRPSAQGSTAGVPAKKKVSLTAATDDQLRRAHRKYGAENNANAVAQIEREMRRRATASG